MMYPNDTLIYDIGLHKGKDTEFYLKKGFKVIAVEANPVLVDLANKKFKTEIEEGRLIIINKAIADKTGQIDFYVNTDKDDWGSIVPDWNTSENSQIKKIQVETIQLNEILQKHGVPYYMKIDIEGADIICLKSLLKSTIKPKFISAELLTSYNLPDNNCSCLDIFSTLKVLGYTKFSISNQKENDKVVCPKPAKEGKYVDYTFNQECSGLFGKELNNSWFSFDELTFQYLNYFHGYQKEPLNYFKRASNKYLKTKFREKGIFQKYSWYDVHATF